MVIRLWLNPRPAPRAGTSVQNDRSRFGYLLQDIVTSRRGTLQAQNKEFMTFSFGHATTALSTAKQLQWAIRGYRGHPSTPAAAAAIALGTETTAGASKISDRDYFRRGDLESLLELAKPAQILITHSTYEDLREFSAIEFRSFSERAGVYEYLWTEAEKLAELQETTEFNATIVQPIIIPEAGGRENAPVPVSPPSAPTQVPPQAEDSPVDRVRTVLGQTSSTARSLLRTSVVGFQQNLRPLWARIGVSSIVVLLLVAAIWLIREHNIKSQPQAASGTSMPTVSTPQQSPPEIKPQQTPATPDTSGTVASGQLNTPAKVPAKTRETRTEPNAGCSIAGQVPAYMKMAERNRANGKYKDAEREFREILNCEPSNAEAKDGLSKVLRAEQEHFGPPGT
jgi:hypothetical protein